MSQQAQALGSATLSRMADTVHAGLTEMRGTTAPRLLLELVCARMLLPATDGSAAATLQRLERLERRMSIAGEHPGRPAAEVPVPEVPVRETPVRAAPVRAAPVREAPVQEAAAPSPVAAPEPDSGARKPYVRPSQRPEQAAPARSASSTAAPAGAADDWPETVMPGSGSARAAQASVPAPATPVPAAPPSPAPRVAAGEPDIPLPPEPTDDEDWPHPASPAATRAAAARTDAAEDGETPPAAPPRAAAESSPAPRGAEPTPVVSADPEPAADGELTTSDVRRVWPELLAVVKRHKRTTEALLKSAQVHGLANGVLTLTATSPALAKMLGDDLNRDVLRQSLSELLGVRWKVTVVVEGAATATGPPVAPEQAREAARAAEAAEASELMAERAAETGGDREPEPAVDPEQAALSLLRAQLGARPVDS
jgi:DNA polymerase-3 subunit gamma/tau